MNVLVGPPGAKMCRGPLLRERQCGVCDARFTEGHQDYDEDV